MISRRPAILAAAALAPAATQAACPDRPAAVGFVDAADRAIISQVESALLVAVTSDQSRKLSLRQRMAELNIPAVSVAVVRDGKLAWTAAWGNADSQSCTQATPATRFQAASISKPIAGLTALAMAEHAAVDLDAPMPRLSNGWQIGLADGGTTLPSLRQLLSHTGGTSVHGFPGYVPGGPVPSVLDILNGTGPANNAPVRSEIPPGREFRYSGGGYTIAQQWLADAGGADYRDLAARHVLRPAAMQASGYTLPARDRASAHVDGQPIEGSYRIHPEWAAAGLWTTPRDLARLAIALQKSLRGEQGALLGKDAMAAAITPIIGGYGIGFSLAREGDGVRFGHDGVNLGFESFWAANDKGRAVAVMTNGAGGLALAQVLFTTIATAEGWSEPASRQVKEVAWSAADRAAVVGHFAGPSTRFEIRERNGRLLLGAFGTEAGELLPIASDQLVMAEHGLTIRIFREGDGQINRLMLDDEAKTNLSRTGDPLASIGSVPMFVRGTMNNWGTTAPLTQAGTIWAAEMELAAGHYIFKLGSEDWATVDLGSPDGSKIPADSSANLRPGGANITVDIPEAGLWRFILDATDKAAPTERVERR